MYNFVNLSAAMLAVVIPGTVTWSYAVFTLVFVVGLVAIFVRGEWQEARGLDKLILFGPIFYAAPLGAVSIPAASFVTLAGTLKRVRWILVMLPEVASPCTMTT